MAYFIAFLEGIITFISPCLLPMLPIYLSYFAGGDEEEGSKHTLCNSLFFVLGFTIVFTLMGSFAGVIGGLLREYQTVINIVTGAIVILFGLSFMGILKLPQIRGVSLGFNPGNLNARTSVLFGSIFAISWTPCVGVFLGSALMMASQQGSVVKGTIMLLLYSLGLGIPFVLSAVLWNSLLKSLEVFKHNYKTVNKVAGVFLIIVGIMMMTGSLGKLLSFLSFV